MTKLLREFHSGRLLKTSDRKFRRRIMKGNKHMKTITNITYPAFALVAFAWFALSPPARAVCQQGCDLINDNTFLGDGALTRNTTGSNNTAVGFNALLGNTTGQYNTALGSQALIINTTGVSNTAIGWQALYYNSTGNANTANGVNALAYNTTGNDNTADGFFALNANTTGGGNTASGEGALLTNTSGFNNTAIGVRALSGATTANENTATGAGALLNDSTGENNIAIGTNALYNNTTGGGNIAVGHFAGINLTTGNSNIDIGNAGVAGESNTIRIGNKGTHTRASIAGISGVTVAGGVAVIVDTSGHLGTIVSSERFKDAVKPMGKASEAILSLKPVTFRYKQNFDPVGIPQFGLVAEQVEKVNPDLVARDEKGTPYTVRYEAVNAMLLNEFLKEYRTVQEQGATITELKKQIAALTAGLQKVSAQLEASKPAQQVVNNP
jgi:hypothetical protein